MIYVFTAVLTFLVAQFAVMLNWWLGKPVGGTATQDGDTEIDPPETPAPLFAARALKSAFFGTPAPAEDDMSYIHTPKKALEPATSSTRPHTSHSSPTKLPGILLTPGTVTSRRKTVSFGNEFVDREVVAVKQTTRTRGNKASRSASLTKALESARNDKAILAVNDSENVSKYSIPLLSVKPDCLGEMHSANDSKIRSQKQNHVQGLMIDVCDGDITMDLNEPHSESGKYWKTEMQKYHEEAQAEMRKLLQYKQKAKNYAKMKDAEVLDLNERLQDEQRCVTQLEQRISRLSARRGPSGRDGNSGDENSPELVKQLAQQRALACQYKKEVDEIRNSLDASLVNRNLTTSATDGLPDFENMAGFPSSKRLEQEILTLQKSLQASEKDNARLRADNKGLMQQLLHSDTRIQKLSEKLEQRQESFEETRRKRDTAMSELQKTYESLKEHTKSQQKEAEDLLKQRQEQIDQLKRQVASTLTSDLAVKELKKSLDEKTIEHNQTVADYEIKIAELKRDVVLGSSPGLDLRASIQNDPSLSNSLARHEASMESPIRTKDSLIPIALQSISRPSKANPRYSRSDTPTNSPPKKAHHPLSEVINNASPNTIPPLQSGPVQFTPAAVRFSDMSSPNPDFDLPSAEPSLLDIPARMLHENKNYPSPHPKMVHISSSPPKPIRSRTLKVEEVRTSNAEKASALGLSRLSGIEDSKARRSIPPERAAAAQARLDKKNAEKKKAQEMAMAGKENVRN